jgi:hypothetical protein
MVISTYQVNNVLRVYRDQLRLGSVSGRQSGSTSRSPDRITISAGGKQKAMMEKISSGIAEKISKYGSQKAPENGFEIYPDSSRNESGDLVYKTVDDQGERINIFSIGDIRNTESFGI